jgi:Helix-turn-helix of DDE superfamily endonuclease/DDE superfamily endonuclease
MNLKDRFLMLSVYYRLYITYTLAGFLFDLDQSNICRDIQKIEGLVRECVPIPQKVYPIIKRLKTPVEEVEKYFPAGFLAFIDSTEQQIPRPVDKRKKKKAYYSGKKKKRYTAVKNQIMVNNRGYIIHKANHKKGKRHDYDVYKRNRPVTPKQVVNVIDLGYLGVEKDFPEQLSRHCRIKRKEIRNCPKKKKSTTNIILKRE